MRATANIDIILYHIDKAKDALQTARDYAIEREQDRCLEMLDEVLYHRDEARKEALKQ